ncbi:MAG TPA: tRNA (N6-threonylcarbamoyladenosine(37)-N6)-methyltransferase TrmO [Methanoregulaceae archaeon]|nr:tRNA (N6-threonylcarbamoyladenosine(37)-N6)-methyltransferase TrmO [Methanoregulaceae archaeon]HPD75220.1 tRNA (N6-threonylcarbamoyladenosine(37)-N6)-methyltransferase TrmO [Methanoregulaceae archaeon]HRY74985.1 tRNA (N6-threonylcarbamoyladenosine(37)-N6)-methyltransferase TrmO [Methanoregulaceae archaeon]
MAIELRPIGEVRSPYKKNGDAPRQGRLSDTISLIVIDPAYRDGLLDLEKRKHLFVLCWFDRADRTRLRATPPDKVAESGVFSIRSPDRPNPVAICLVDLLGVENGVLRVRGLDAFNGTLVIDIKPYFADLDSPETCGRETDTRVQKAKKKSE